MTVAPDGILLQLDQPGLDEARPQVHGGVRGDETVIGHDGDHCGRIDRDRRIHHLADHLVELLQDFERRRDERPARVLDLVERDDVNVP